MLWSGIFLFKKTARAVAGWGGKMNKRFVVEGSCRLFLELFVHSIAEAVDPGVFPESL